MEAPWDVASLRREIEEKTQDWKTFSNARAMIRARVLEVRDSKSQLTPLPQWSGTDAVLGSLDLSIHAMERTLLELHEMLKYAEAERPQFKVLDGGKDG
jgi:hypothetical protein